MTDDVADLIRQLNGRIRILEKIKDPIVLDEVFVVLRLIDGLHRTVLGKVATRLRELQVWEPIVADEDIATLFGLYDLVALDAPEIDDNGEELPAPRRKLPVVNGPVFEEIAHVDHLESQQAVVMSTPRPIMLVRDDEAVYAYDPQCPRCGTPLAEALVKSKVLLCPARNCSFDLRTGRPTDGVGPGLRVYPITVREGRVLLAVDTAPTLSWK